jgi:hypothetical protein
MVYGAAEGHGLEPAQCKILKSAAALWKYWLYCKHRQEVQQVVAVPTTTITCTKYPMCKVCSASPVLCGCATVDILHQRSKLEQSCGSGVCTLCIT